MESKHICRIQIGQSIYVKYKFICIFKPDKRCSLFKIITVILSLYLDTSKLDFLGREKQMLLNPMVSLSDFLTDRGRFICEFNCGQSCSPGMVDRRSFVGGTMLQSPWLNLLLWLVCVYIQNIDIKVKINDPTAYLKKNHKHTF